MQVFNQVQAIRDQVSEWKQARLKVGFVPTMGNLHAGHLSLVRLAQKSCDKVVVSIFVNPTQFGPNEDFDSYPRTFEADQQKLQELATDAVFYPSVEEMYPNGLKQTLVQVPADLTGLLEGSSRPEHFDGVTTVVCKLFNMVQPHKAVFGQKDFQQLVVLKKMVAELAIPIEIIGAPIERDSDGLALSSRNQYLNPEQRSIAPKLYESLQEMAQQLINRPVNFAELENKATARLLHEGFDKVDYVKVCNPATLRPASEDDKTIVILTVARLGSTRILDNILL